MKPIPFFTDNCVPDSVGEAVVARRHLLVRLRDVMLTESEDRVVGAACVAGGHILVSCDSDFKAIAKRFNVTKRTYREQLHKIALRCDEPLAAKRLSEAMSIVEHEWALVLAGREVPLSIELTNHAIRIVRWPGGT